MDLLQQYKVTLCVSALLISTNTIADNLLLASAKNIGPADQQFEAVEADTVETKTVEVERVEVETLETDTVEAEIIEAEIVEAEIVEAETVEAETVEAETVEAETVEAETVEAEIVEAETTTNLTQAEVIQRECERIAGKLSSVELQECLQRGLTESGALSSQQTPLLIKEYPPLDERPPQAKILMLGGIHGDEYSSVTIMFKWMQTLDKYHSGLFHWKVTPLVNPDGLLQKESQRMNANGVDLNRNFDNGISDKASLEYWEKRTYQDPRRYPGKAPLSEPETRWVKQLIDEFKPDAIVAVHAPYGIVDFDGPHKPPSQLGPLHLNLLGTYPGSLGNYAGLQLNIPVVTVELPHAGIMPSEKEVSHIWVDLVSWLRKNVPVKASKVAANKVGSSEIGPNKAGK